MSLPFVLACTAATLRVASPSCCKNVVPIAGTIPHGKGGTLHLNVIRDYPNAYTFPMQLQQHITDHVVRDREDCDVQSLPCCEQVLQ
jgi:hypothetical protein